MTPDGDRAIALLAFATPSWLVNNGKLGEYLKRERERERERRRRSGDATATATAVPFPLCVVSTGVWGSWVCRFSPPLPWRQIFVSFSRSLVLWVSRNCIFVMVLWKQI